MSNPAVTFSMTTKVSEETLTLKQVQGDDALVASRELPWPL